MFAVDFHFVDTIPQDAESSASDVDGRLEGGYRNVPTSDKKMLTLGKPSWWVIGSTRKYADVSVAYLGKG